MKKTNPKIAYASVLFGKTPEDTFQIAKNLKEKNFKAIKFGWENFGIDLKKDEEHLIAARDAMQNDLELMIDVGAIWGTDVEEAKKRFAAAMSNDLGTPDALAVVFDLITAGNASLDSQDFDAARCFLATVTELLEVLGLSQVEKEDDDDIEALIQQRETARKEKDFEEADRIRDQLHSQGIEIEDTPTGALWRYR